MNSLSESVIEKESVKYAVRKGWKAYKWSSPGVKGVHDQLFFKKGVCFTIEFKSLNKKATAQQKAVAEELAKSGIVSRVCDNLNAAMKVIDLMDEKAKTSIIYEDVIGTSSFES